MPIKYIKGTTELNKARTLVLQVEYDGTNYFGFQRQTGKEDTVPTVQGTLERVIERGLGRHFDTKGSGRTDKGVHALCQIVSFAIPSDYTLNIPLDGMKKLLNKMLPNDIMVKGVSIVEGDFHALGSSRSKTYMYVVNYGPPDVFSNRYSWHVRKKIDLEKLREINSKFKGRLYCAPFCDGEVDLNEIESFYKNILTFRFYDMRSRKKLFFFVEGEGFLYKMVRRLVGFSIEYAYGRFDMKHAEKIMREHELRSTYVTAPARGLFLYKVKY